MKKTIISALVSISCIIYGCQSTTHQNVTSTELPQLLMRSKIIGPENEMGHMLDQYTKLTTAIKHNPNDQESKLGLAELFMMEARISGEHGHYYPAALQMINDAMAHELKAPIAYRAMLDKASVLLSLHQFSEAKEIGEQALAINPHSADIYGVLVDANVELGYYKDAVQYADKMVSIRPDLRSYSRVSYLREIHGMVDESIAAMKLAVAAGYPGMEQTEWARLTLGHLYERYGMLDSAQLQYAIALTERPNYPFAIAALSEIYSAKGQLVLADSLNDVAMSLIPEVSFFISRASREMKRGKLAKGQAMTREILEMFADDEKAGHQMSLEMARVQMNLLNSPEQALNYAMKEYNIRPENIDVNRVLAEIYFTKGDLIKAKEHLDKALATGSKDPATLCLDGMLQLKTGQEANGTKLLKSVFVEIPYLECSYCADARKIIL